MPYVVIAYDITDDKRRLRVSKTLRNFLERVQRSVYEGELTSSQLNRLMSKVRPLLDEEEDVLRVYILCAACRQRIQVFGHGDIVKDPDMWII